jgi:hypothetical protein
MKTTATSVDCFQNISFAVYTNHPPLNCSLYTFKYCTLKCKIGVIQLRDKACYFDKLFFLHFVSSVLYRTAVQSPNL